MYKHHILHKKLKSLQVTGTHAHILQSHLYGLYIHLLRPILQQSHISISHIDRAYLNPAALAHGDQIKCRRSLIFNLKTVLNENLLSINAGS